MVSVAAAWLPAKLVLWLNPVANGLRRVEWATADGQKCRVTFLSTSWRYVSQVVIEPLAPVESHQSWPRRSRKQITYVFSLKGWKRSMTLVRPAIAIFCSKSVQRVVIGHLCDTFDKNVVREWSITLCGGFVVFSHERCATFLNGVAVQHVCELAPKPSTSNPVLALRP